MRVVQRTSAIVSWAALAAVAVLMVMTASGVLSDQWQESVAQVVDWIANPQIEQWVAALLGGLLALIAFIVVFAQFAPSRRVVAGVTIDQSAHGSTEVTAPIVYRAITHRLSTLEDVHTVTPIPEPRRFKFKIDLTDSGRIDRTTAAARTALDPEFWATLGMAPMTVDLLLTYRKGATPVTRKEQLA